MQSPRSRTSWFDPQQKFVALQSRRSTSNLRGRRIAKHGANRQAQLAGRPLEVPARAASASVTIRTVLGGKVPGHRDPLPYTVSTTASDWSYEPTRLPRPPNTRGQRAALVEVHVAAVEQRRDEPPFERFAGLAFATGAQSPRGIPGSRRTRTKRGQCSRPSLYFSSPFAPSSAGVAVAAGSIRLRSSTRSSSASASPPLAGAPLPSTKSANSLRVTST